MVILRSQNLSPKNQLANSVPPDLVCETLTFLSVSELLNAVAPVSKQFHQLANRIVGAEENPAVHQNAVLNVSPFPPLQRRYRLLRDLFERYETLCENNQVPVSTPGHLDVFRACEVVCAEYVTSHFESLVVMDERDLRELASCNLLESKAKACPFALFVKLVDNANFLAKQREKYLYSFFSFNDENVLVAPVASRRRNTRGRLTERGIHVCNRIFDFFDIDKDERLGWEELSAINEAAGLPLSRNAFAWVQGNYDVDGDGKLTRQGYQDMFLENFMRVPRLMCKDLVRLQEFMDAAAKSPRDLPPPPQVVEMNVSTSVRDDEHRRIREYDIHSRPTLRRRLGSSSSDESMGSRGSFLSEEDEEMDEDVEMHDMIVA